MVRRGVARSGWAGMARRDAEPLGPSTQGDEHLTQITLTPWEREWAEYVGVKRHEVNLKRGDAAHYDPQRMQDNLTASIASCVGELAAAKHLNKYWSGSFWDVRDHNKWKHLADVGENTEVKRIRKPGNPLPVRWRDVEAERVNVLVYPHPPDFVVVDVIGYGLAKQLWTVGDPAMYDEDGTRLVKQRFLIAL